jgi:hypothetical protein
VEQSIGWLKIQKARIAYIVHHACEYLLVGAYVYLLKVRDLEIYLHWGKLYLAQSREYSHNSKCYYTVILILGVATFLLFYFAKIYSSDELPQ